MNLNILANNLRRLRTEKGLSQADLKRETGLSLPTIKNLENAKNEPRFNTVQAIARALEVRLQDLFIPTRELKTVRFRSSKRMQNRTNILAEVSRWLDDIRWLEELLDNRIPLALSNISNHANKFDRSEMARQCRQNLGLNSTEPILDI